MLGIKRNSFRIEKSKSLAETIDFAQYKAIMKQKDLSNQASKNDIDKTELLQHITEKNFEQFHYLSEMLD